MDPNQGTYPFTSLLDNQPSSSHTLHPLIECKIEQDLDDWTFNSNTEVEQSTFTPQNVRPLFVPVKTEPESDTPYFSPVNIEAELTLNCDFDPVKQEPELESEFDSALPQYPVKRESDSTITSPPTIENSAERVVRRRIKRKRPFEVENYNFKRPETSEAQDLSDSDSDISMPDIEEINSKLKRTGRCCPICLKDFPAKHSSELFAHFFANHCNDGKPKDEGVSPTKIVTNKNSVKQNSCKKNVSSIQHSFPAQNIMPPYFPTSWSTWDLRHFHRKPLKRLEDGPLSKNRFQPIHSIEEYMKNKERDTKRTRKNEVFFMREPEDLSGKDGDIICCEYSEEHPPLLQQAGMASKIINYYKPTTSNADEKPEIPYFQFGEPVIPDKPPFLGEMVPGESLQSLENNMFRAPMYEHQPSPTDFLVIRTESGYFLRVFPSLFCIGQLCPLLEVPSPKSKRSTNFVRDSVLTFIYRLFWKSKYYFGGSKKDSRRLDSCHLREAFPYYAESAIRKRLKSCSDFKRLTDNNGCWVLKSDYRLPSKEQIREMVTPEMCCAHYSMLAGNQRLKDAGYGEDYFFSLEDDNEDEVTIADEIKCAPWNTTGAYIGSMFGENLLDLIGVADPTGCGQGFSYVRVSTRQKASTGRIVTGTDADLRKIPLNDAKQILREFGVKEEDINTLKRWEIINVIRLLSTQQAEHTWNNSGIARFARGKYRDFNPVKMQYEQKCQRIFDLQNRVLSSADVLSSDESTEESDTEKNSSPGCRKLRICRTFRSEDGTEYEKTEVVTEPQLIDAYYKIRTTRDQSFIKNFAQMDADYINEKRREKRRLQDKLRRIRRNETKAKLGLPVGREKLGPRIPPIKPPPKNARKLMKMKCGACGGRGHMKTNRECPFYVEENSCEIKEEETLFEKVPSGQLLSVEGTKVKISRSVVEVKKVKENTLKMKFSERKVKRRPIRKLQNRVYPKAKQRRRADPGVTFGVYLNEIIQELITLPHSQYFLAPVSKKLVPDYYDIVEKPMDLKTIKAAVRKSSYETRESFLSDIQQIVDNSFLYNGDSSEITNAARKLYELASLKIGRMEQILVKLEKAINPLLDDNMIWAFNFILANITQQCKNLPNSYVFHRPVDIKVAKSYYDKVKEPRDLGMIEQKVKEGGYTKLKDYLRDMEQICKNSKVFTGAMFVYIFKAKEIWELARNLTKQQEPQLKDYESRIQMSTNIDSTVTDIIAQTGESNPIKVETY